MRKLLLLWIALLAFSMSYGQTVLISNVGDGGFENGATPAANNWTAVNSSTDGWYVGAAPVVSNGVNCGYISSTAGVDWTYSQLSVIQHLYYDVTIPAGESKITLTFKWKAYGEGTTTSDWDNLKLFFGTVANIGTPVANTAISSTYQISGPGAISGMYKLNSTAWNSETINLTGTPGTTYRLVFSWKSDGSTIGNPPAAIDDVLLTSAAPDPLHGLYTINNLLPTSMPMVHDGTGNFASFTAAINYMNSEGISGPVTLAVIDGQTFVEDCPAITATGTSVNTILFTKAGSGTNPVITPTGTTGTTDAGITINGGDYITFNAIDIAIASGSAVEYGYYIKNASATDGAQHNTIANCKITLNRTNTSSRGISVYNATTPTNVSGSNSYTLIHKNTIENCYYGMQLTGNSGYPLESCVIDSNIVGAATANDIGGGSSATSGIRTTYASNVSIFANLVRNVYTTSAVAHGIFLENGVGTNNNVANNVVYTISTTSTTATNYVYAVRVEPNAGSVINVFNNMASDLSHGITTASTTISIRALAVGVSGGTGVANLAYNSVYFTEDAIPSSAAIYMNTSTVNAANNVLFNNSPGGTTSKRYAIYRSSGTLNSDNNDLFVQAGTNNFVGYYTADQATLANWQTATLQDAHSISVDPTFTSLTDLHTTNSALNGTAMVIAAITTDIDGETRDAMFPDMGADENLAPPTFSCTTPTPGNTVASSTALCYGDGVLLTLQNATPGTGVGYQWQSSTDGVSYSDITGATNNSYSTILSEPTYFQCVVTCYNGPVSGTSTPVFVAFAYEITSTTPASRCGTGSVSLEATGTAGTTITWFDSVADTIVGTGSPWITPVISSTTTYNVAAVSSSPAIIPVGAGATTSSTYSNPFYSLWSNIHTQHMIRKEELIAAGLSAGNITSLALDFTSAGTLPTIDLSIKIGTSNASDMSAFVDNSMFTVVYTNASYMPTSGINTFTFLTPFYWNGNSNIVLEFCHGNGSSTATMSRTVKADATTFVSSIKTHVSAATAASVICPDITTNLTSYSTRPQFIFAGQSACSSISVPVIATIGSSPALTLTADQTVCNNAAAQIDVTSTLTDYDSYVWTPETDLYTDAACTTPYTTGASATTIYLKSTTAGSHQIICSANNSGTGCANMDTTNITVLPDAPVASASPASICLSGSSSLTVTPNTGWSTAAFQWMESTDNVTFSDIVGANSISYTTPVITDTMYYKMVVELGATVCTESNVAVVEVNNPQIISTTPATRCGDGTLTLDATSSTGTTINWYENATGGLPVGSGNSFTTPSISSTTSYYVAAEIIAPTTDVITIGNGSSSSTSAGYTPYYTLYESSKVQILYLASELSAAGMNAGNITSMAVNLASVSTTTMENFEVSMGSTALTDLTTTYESGLTSVYSAATYMPAGTGWQTVTFTSPFYWDGVSNIILQICEGNNAGWSTASGVYYSATTFNSIHYGYMDGGTGCSMTSPTNNYVAMRRPDVRFENIGVCSSPRTEVVATITTPPTITVTATPATICLNETTDLEATSSNTGYSYVWEPGTLSGATQTVTPTGTTTYNVTATDNSGGANDGCVAVGSVLVSVNPIPVNVVAAASDSSICAGGTVDLFGNVLTTDTLLAESFENGGTIPTGWGRDLDVDGNSTNAAITFINTSSYPSGYSAYDGTYFVRFNSYTVSSGNTARLKTTDPISTIGLGNISVDFAWFQDSIYTNDDSVIVQYSLDGSTWTSVPPGFLRFDSTTHWSVQSVTLPAAAENQSELYIGFLFYSAYGNDCHLDDVHVIGNSANTYSWTSAPAGFTSALQNPVGVAPTANTTYTFTVENTFGCSVSDDVAVTVNPIPVVNLGSDQSICDTTTITLDAGNAGSTYVWSTGGTAQTEDVLGSDLGIGANTVSVDVTSAAGCTGTGSVTITVTVCDGIEDPTMHISYFPNPATDMLNLDLSELPAGDYSFEMFNMQGQKVMNRILVNDGNVILVNLLDVAPGSYVISVTGNNNSFRNYLTIQE